MRYLRLLAVGWALLAVPANAADESFFRAKIAPLLQQHCVRCHEGEQAKGGLNLATGPSALAGGDSGAAIVPGQPDKSLLLEYVSGDEPYMPQGGDPLSDQQVAWLRQWIAAEAVWPEDLVLKAPHSDTDWWSLQPLVEPEVPDIESDWIRTPVDAFILAKLQEQGLSPAPEADRRTLIRRLHYDLHGLPPTPTEVEAFVNDPDPNAYENLVDRLLTSSRYGERWARHWLDIVHYGDTHGYDKDKRREHAWPYRDYVIRAFNEDKPYRRFVQEQLAGDILYPHTRDGIVATGFLVAGPWDFVGHVELREGTVDKKITRSLDRDDMVMNTMSTFTSLTVHCARCHDHKFDPITQEDYYSLQAVFAGIDRANRPYTPDPEVARLRAELLARQQSLRAKRKTFQEKIASLSNGEIKRLDERVAQLRQDIIELIEPTGKNSSTLGYHSSIMPSPDHEKWVQVDLGRSVALDQIILIPAHVQYGGHPGPGFGFPPRFRIEISNDSEFNSDAVTIADHTQADYPHPGNAPVSFDAGGRRGRYVRVTATQLWERTEDWIFALSELIAITDGRNVAQGGTVTSLDSIENSSWNRKALVDGFGSRRDLGLMENALPSRLMQAAEKQSKIVRLTSERKRLVESLIDEPTRNALAEIQSQLADIDKELSSLPNEQPVYAAATQFERQGNFTATDGRPRPIRLLHRGSVKSPGELVGPGTVSCLPELESRFDLENPNQEGQRRVALARWMVDRRNPLTWRSIVNRIWQYHFGRGIVSTPNDFGHMGTQPTHPELLNWLAVHFRDNGQSFKELHRLLVTSSVYRQSSQLNEPFARIDAGNRYLWRMNRRRLEAEEIRDAVLTVSRRMNWTMYGPGFDLFVFQDDHSPHYYYSRYDHNDPRAMRRSIYRFIVRSVPDPFLETLDCADPSLNVPVRNTTVTALQALALLNNRFMVQQAEYFAARLRAEAEEAPAQIETAYQLALNRAPTPEEIELLAAYAEEHGLANLCRLIFNMNEFVFID